MAYQVRNTRNQIIATVADTTVDNTTLDIDLIGKNYAEYGIIQNQNFVAILENFANTSAPSSPVEGQCWYDVTLKQLKVYTNAGWKNVGSSTVSNTQPTAPITGDLWYDSSTAAKQLYVYNGASWELVGPDYSAEQGLSGQKITTLVDALYPVTPDYVVIEFYVSGVLGAIFSVSPEFTPSPAITGFATIKPGFNLSTSVANLKFNGTATNADSLGGVTATNFLRKDVNDVTQGSLTIISNAGLNVGTTNNASLLVASDTVILRSNNFGRNIDLRANVGGVSTTILTVDATSGRATVNADPTQALGIATKQYVDSQLGSTITASAFTSGNISNSTISTSSFSGTVNNSSINNSTINSSSIISTNISSSTYSGGSIVNATIAGGNFSNGVLSNVQITASSLTNNTATNLAISNSTVTSTNMSNISFTGANNTAPTALGNNNTNQIATTAFVQLQKNSPTFFGEPTAPTAAPGTSTNQLATTAFVTSAVGGLDLSAKADRSVEIIAGAGLTGGGNLAASRTLSISNTGVTADTYGLAGTNTTWRVPVFTVNARGQITAASSWAVPVNSNAYGTRTVSTAAPTGGVDGDIWLQV